MKVTTKGQVTIPARIRGYLGIAPRSDVDFLIRRGEVLLVKKGPAEESARTSRFAARRGMLQGKFTTEAWMKATRGE